MTRRYRRRTRVYFRLGCGPIGCSVPLLAAAAAIVAALAILGRPATLPIPRPNRSRP